MVLPAWQRLTEAYGPPAFDSSYTPLTEAWIVYAAWPLAAIVLALIAIQRRDA